MSNKKYKLLRDLPDADAGTVLTFTDEGDSEGYLYPDKFGMGNIWCRKETVEQNPTWFREVKPEKIEVMVWSVHERNQYGENYHYAVPLGYEIPKDKFPAIKKAIEGVLNDNSVFDQEMLNRQIDKLKAMEAAFNAAREDVPYSIDQFDKPSIESTLNKYSNFNHYLKSLQP